MRRLGRTAALLAGVLLFVLSPMALAVWLAGPRLDDLCRDHTIGQARSPDGRYVAWVLWQDCGAVTSGPLHINLREAARPLPTDIPGGVPEGWVYSDPQGSLPEFYWRDNTHFVIGARLSDPVNRQSRWRDVSIVYVPQPIEIRHRRTGALLRTVWNLWAVDLHGAKLPGADLEQQDMTRANLRGANLRYAAFGTATLVRADLRGADLTGAEMSGACIQGADLTGARLDGANLSGACYDDHTRWPAGFDPLERGAMRVE